MSIQHLTIVICDRCKTEARFEADGPGEPQWWLNYALAWPAHVTPYTGWRETLQDVLPSVMVCSDCLTDEEREQATEMRLHWQASGHMPLRPPRRWRVRGPGHRRHAPPERSLGSAALRAQAQTRRAQRRARP